MGLFINLVGGGHWPFFLIMSYGTEKVPGELAIVIVELYFGNMMPSSRHLLFLWSCFPKSQMSLLGRALVLPDELGVYCPCQSRASFARVSQRRQRRR